MVNMAKTTSIYWFTPVCMVGGLFFGVLFAIGHHLFYHSLAGTNASNGAYSVLGYGVSKQQTNTSIGTAFGFIVKASLVFAVSTVYVQFFWRAVRTSSSKAGVRLSYMDATFAGLDDVLAFLDVKTWLRSPMLLLLAAVTW